jgi:hypothetical protein
VEISLTEHLIGLLSVFASTSLGFLLIIRRYHFLTNPDRIAYEKAIKEQAIQLKEKDERLSEKEKKLESQQLIISSVLHEIHHNGPVQNIQRVIGILSVYRLEVSNLTKRLLSMGLTTWGEAIRIDFQESEDKYINVALSEAKKAQEKILKAAEPLNDL